MNTIDEILLRWKAPMPAFFATIYNWAMVLLIICSGILILNDDLVKAGIDLPNWLVSIGAVASAVSALLSKLTVDRNAKRTADRISTLKSSWWVSVVALFSTAGSYLGWVILAVLIGWLAYMPVRLLINRYVIRANALRSNRKRRRVDRVADLYYTLQNWPVG